MFVYIHMYIHVCIHIHTYAGCAHHDWRPRAQQEGLFLPPLSPALEPIKATAVSSGSPSVRFYLSEASSRRPEEPHTSSFGRFKTA